MPSALLLGGQLQRQRAVHLSWGANHSLQNLSKGVLDNLRLLGFDGSQWVALDTGLDNKHFYFKDAVDEASGSLHNTGTIDLSGFSALALGSLKDLGWQQYHDLRLYPKWGWHQRYLVYPRHRKLSQRPDLGL